MTTYPELTWHVLNPELQAGVDGDRVVAILYTVQAADDAGNEWLEFCCLLTGPPSRQEVLFGVGEGAAQGWENRWDRGRAACEYVYADAQDEAGPAART